MSHTKGPWSTGEYVDGNVSPNVEMIVVTAPKSKKWVQEICSFPVKGRARANARLIAAAPDMLTMLRELSTWLVSPDCSPETIEHIKSRIDAEIQHATGRREDGLPVPPDNHGHHFGL